MTSRHDRFINKESEEDDNSIQEAINGSSFEIALWMSVFVLWVIGYIFSVIGFFHVFEDSFSFLAVLLIVYTIIYFFCLIFVYQAGDLMENFND